MDVFSLMELIERAGFPIVCVLLMFWFLNKQSDRHREEISVMTQALNNNTLVLRQLVDKLGVEDDFNLE